MAGEAAVPLAEPVLSTHKHHQNVDPYETATVARENQITVEDFAPGVVTESVAQIGETTGTGDERDQGLLVVVSLSWTSDGLLK